MNELATAPADVVDVPALPAASALAPDRHPAAVHLASLVDGPGCVSMRSMLAHAAAMLVTALDSSGLPASPRSAPLALPRAGQGDLRRRRSVSRAESFCDHRLAGVAENDVPLTGSPSPFSVPWQV